MASWDELLSRSRRLEQGVEEDSQFPPIQRSLDQLEVLSKQLKTRTARPDTLAATRLLAQEGINADQLTQDLKNFELKTTFEDVFPSEALSVDQYVQQMHEMIMLSVIQEAQEDNVNAFEDYIFLQAEADWNQEKRHLLASLASLPAPRPLPGTQLAGSPWQPASGGAAWPAGAAAGGATGAAQELLADPRAVAYARVVRDLNAAREKGQPFKVATAFRDACQQVTAAASVGVRTVTPLKIWQCIQALVGEEREERADARGLDGRLRRVAWARGHLEGVYEKHIAEVINSNPGVAALGGAPGRLPRVRAFLRVRLAAQGLLDFDAGEQPRQPPVDTTWVQIYTCLRAGYWEEALQVSRASRASHAFEALLAEWVKGGGRVAASVAAAAAEECDKLARTAERSGWRPGYDRKRMLCHALVAGTRAHAERLLRDVPMLFSTIEDFLWFRLALVREVQAGPAADAPAGGWCSLAELQSYLGKFQPSYYSKGGRDPLLYAYVLLLSLQLRAALAHLSQQPEARIEAVHAAVALAAHGALGEEDVEASNDAANAILQQGAAYVAAGDLRTALEYYAAAAEAITGVPAGMGAAAESAAKQRQRRARLLEHLLVELLQRPGGLELLLGRSGCPGPEGALARFVPDAGAQRALVLAAARHCEDAGQLEEAVELFRRAEHIGAALTLINRGLSEAVRAARTRKEAFARAAALEVDGAELAAAAQTRSGLSGESEGLAKALATFDQLQQILKFYRLFQEAKYREAVWALARLPFIPMEGRSVDKCVEALDAAAHDVESCAPELLVAALSCVEGSGDSSEDARNLKNKIMGVVASSLQRNWPQEVFERVASMRGVPQH